ncbi:MAG: tetratricopeptide repeat protein [Acidobacteria bacterium]|nr:tetratricopeptide repeat protein [Acidobacteriota bacterium]
MREGGVGSRLGRSLLLAFLLYLAAFPAWRVVQPGFRAATVRIAGTILPRLEFPALTKRLDLQGGELRIYGAGAEEPIGRWVEVAFPFYLPFVLILILCFPGVPGRDRVGLALAAIAALAWLHVLLIAAVVEPVHHRYLLDRGAEWLSPAGLRALSFLRRFLFHLGNKMFPAAAIFLLFLRYGRARGAVPSPIGRRGWGTFAAAGAALVLLPLVWGAVRPAWARRSPRYENLQLVLGNLHERGGHLAEAAAAFREAAGANPDNPRAWNNLGVILARAGDWEGARDGFRRALQADPEFSAAGRGLGLALLRLGDPCNALTALEKAGPPDPGSPDGTGPDLLETARRRCAEAGPGGAALDKTPDLR